MDHYGAMTFEEEKRRILAHAFGADRTASEEHGKEVDYKGTNRRTYLQIMLGVVAAIVIVSLLAVVVFLLV